ncbi:response regulator [Variovorax sp. PAMC28562]|nr:response regulator [Variovorax sp. PAMC28562]
MSQALALKFIHDRIFPMTTDVPHSNDARDNPPNPEGASAVPGKLRVLVVEDDAAALSATVELLQLLGHWATGVKSAEVAKSRFMDGAFDVLLTDIGLPALSGYDLVQSLPSGHRIQVIFASGQIQPDDPMPGTIWLAKPFTVEQLEAALATARAA